MNRSDKGKSAVASEKRGAGRSKKPNLKGLERRRKSNRRADARRNMDAGKNNKPVSEGPQNTSLADEAAGQVAQLYNVLFDGFPTIEAVIIDSNRVDECRETLAAMRQMLDILHRQEERIELLKELEQDCQSDAVQLERSREIAETFMEFLEEFASDRWVKVVKQIKASE